MRQARQKISQRKYPFDAAKPEPIKMLDRAKGRVLGRAADIQDEIGLIVFDSLVIFIVKGAKLWDICGALLIQWLIKNTSNSIYHRLRNIY